MATTTIQSRTMPLKRTTPQRFGRPSSSDRRPGSEGRGRGANQRFSRPSSSDRRPGSEGRGGGRMDVSGGEETVPGSRESRLWWSRPGCRATTAAWSRGRHILQPGSATRSTSSLVHPYPAPSFHCSAMTRLGRAGLILTKPKEIRCELPTKGRMNQNMKVVSQCTTGNNPTLDSRYIVRQLTH